MGTLIVETGSLRGRRLALPEGRSVHIGRDPRCALHLDDAMASRVHLTLSWVGGCWRLEDRGSSNGTMVNDAPVKTATLAPGDVIQVGETLISFSAEADDPLLGSTVGGYRIEKRVGGGGMGTVYLAHQLSIDRPVALKILAPRFAGDAAFIASFLQEARAAGRLNHPHVVQVYDAGREGSSTYISMEYLEGGNLAELLVREGRLAPERGVKIALDAARALAFAERQRIVHRDIKPANLLMDAEGTVKIGDLGIAADLRRAGASQALRGAGSPRYMAPEQARGGAVDHRADIYALGATLYHALAGSPPFDGASAREILAAKLESDPEPLGDLVPEVSAVVQAAVERMMARDPDQRFASAAECEEALEAARTARGARPGRRGPPRRRRAARAARIARAARPAGRGRPPAASLWIGAGAVVVVLIAGLVLATLARRQDDPARLSGRGGAGGGAASGENGRAGGPSAASPATPPAPRAPPARDDSLALRELGEVYLAWTRGELGREEAEARLEAAAAGPASPVVKARAKDLREDIAKGAAEREREAAGAARDTDLRVAASIEAAKLREAAIAIADFKQRFPAAGERLAARERELEAAVSSLVAERRRAAEGLIAAGDLDGAGRVAEGLRALLPPAAESAAGELRATVDEARRRRENEAAAVAGAAGQVYEAIARLDFAAAESALPAGVPEVGPAGRLRRSFEGAREVWTRLTASLDEKPAHRLAFLPTALERAGGAAAKGAPRTLVVASRESDALRLEVPARKTFERRSVFSLETASLLDLLGPAAAASPEGAGAAELRRGLGLLLLLRAGAERARPLLLDPALEAPAREEAEDLIAEAGDVWLRVRHEEARALEAGCAGGPADGWEHVAETAAELLLGSRGRPGLNEARADLAALYARARARALALLPPEGFFHARSMKALPDGGVRLSYDFSSEEELRDFVPRRDAVVNPVRWVKARKLMILKGEVRLLAGNAFRERLFLEAAVGVPDPSAPNVNVGLWTREGDAVSVTGANGLDLRRWRDGRGDAPGGYFVFAQGYRLPFEVEDLLPAPGRDDRFGRFARGFRSFLPAYLREPSFAILAAAHGASLHRDERELIWEMPSSSTLRGGAFRFTLAMRSGEIEWTANGKRLSFAESLHLQRLREGVPHTGSVTFFTNESEVHFSKLEVEGTLDPKWLARQAEAQAAIELATLGIEAGGKKAGAREGERETAERP
jgi:pSer/pThr/pTyr-binding forkhead associated (FHA) protein